MHPDSDPNSHLHTNVYLYTYGDSHEYADRDGNCDGNYDSYRHGHAHCNPHIYTDTDGRSAAL